MWTRLSSGTPDSEVFVALMDASERYGIPKDYFHEIIKGVEMDLEISRYARLRGAVPVLLQGGVGGGAGVH